MINNKIFDFLKQFGSIYRIIKVPTTDPITQTIVEFEYGNAVRALETSVLPYRRPCGTRPEVIHHVQSLASIYTSDMVTSATNIYISGLKDLAKLSGGDFADILREELAGISEFIRSETPIETGENPVEPELPLTQSDIQATAPGIEVKNFLSPRGERTCPFHLPTDQLSTPEVQHVVVEHIVKSSEIFISPLFFL